MSPEDPVGIIELDDKNFNNNKSIDNRIINLN